MNSIHRFVVLLVTALALGVCGASSRLPDSTPMSLSFGPTAAPTMSSTTRGRLSVVVQYAGQRTAASVVSLRVVVLDPASGRAWGEPASAIRPIGVTSQTIDVHGIRPGLWQVVVTAFDASGEVIGLATRPAEVVDGPMTTVTIAPFQPGPPALRDAPRVARKGRRRGSRPS